MLSKSLNFLYVLVLQEHKWIINKSDGYCLDVNQKSQMILSRCKRNNPNQMWEFGILNRTAFQDLGNNFN